MMPCPVVGMTEAACLTALMLGGRFGLVTFGGVETYRDLIGRHGLSSRLSGLAGLDLTPPDAVRDPEGAAARVLEAVERLAREGADAVVLGGAALAGMDRRLAGRASVPLLDGVACAVKQAEALVALALPKPRVGSYAAPAGRASVGLSPALTSRLKGG
jgi:allantoin racemase